LHLLPDADVLLSFLFYLQLPINSRIKMIKPAVLLLPIVVAVYPLYYRGYTCTAPVLLSIPGFSYSNATI